MIINIKYYEKIMEHLDSCVQSVILKFQKRAELGYKKYGVTLDRTDLSVLDWIQHAQEEHMDAILYLEKLKKEIIHKDEQNKFYDCPRCNKVPF